MTGLAWCLAAALAAAGAALTGRAIGRRRAQRRARELLAAQARLELLRAEGALAIDPEAAFLRFLAGHHDLLDHDRREA